MMVFLRCNHQETYVEMTNQYAQFMSYRHQSDLKNYIYDTGKLIEEKSTKNDVVVVEEGKHQDGRAFQLEEREKVLTKFEVDPIVPHVA